MITLPGLIDPHVHLRDPGQTHKEDFTTGTAAALAGGFTTILDMPNNAVPITTEKLLDEKITIARDKILCDVGFHFGSLGEELIELLKVQGQVFGLKIYLNQTAGNFKVDLKSFEKICRAWYKSSPVLIHAEEDILEKALEIAKEHQQHIHVCHTSSKSELKIIIKAREKGHSVTCGVTPHHLFLTNPQFLWQNLKYIDIIESGHAPYAKEEKESVEPPFGIAGLETTLPLLLNAANLNKITIEEIIRLCHTNPSKIFNIKTDPLTKIVIDENEEWTVDSSKFFTKSKSSPVNGWKIKGKVKKVYLHDEKVFENGKILVEPGFGKILYNTIKYAP